MTDPITDMLNRIRNALAVQHQTVEVPFSNLKYEIAKILKNEGFLESFEKKGTKSKKIIKITLRYDEKIPAISSLKRISKSGQRIYISAQEIKKPRGSYGIAIISTSKGLMTTKKAKKQNLGGELICEIW